MALACGAALLAFVLIAVALTLWERRVREYSFWISSLLFSLGTLATITLGRFEHGFVQAMASRYTTFSILVVVSVYAILIQLALERRSFFTVGSSLMLGVLVLFSLPVAYSNSIEMGQETKASRVESAHRICAHASRPEEVTLVGVDVHPHPESKSLEEAISTLDRLDYNVFANPRCGS